MEIETLYINGFRFDLFYYNQNLFTLQIDLEEIKNNELKKIHGSLGEVIEKIDNLLRVYSVKGNDIIHVKEMKDSVFFYIETDDSYFISDGCMYDAYSKAFYSRENAFDDFYKVYFASKIQYEIEEYGALINHDGNVINTKDFIEKEDKLTRNIYYDLEEIERGSTEFLRECVNLGFYANNFPYHLYRSYDIYFVLKSDVR